MPGGVGYSWFEVELVSYHVPEPGTPAGDVLVLEEERLEVNVPLPPGSLILLIAPSANLAVAVGNSANLSVETQQPEDGLTIIVPDSQNLKIVDP